jgi:hypothetical protein
MSMIPDMENYFRGFIPRRDALLRELEEEAKRESIPIVGPVVGELLYILARMSGAKNILELGTATGYSGIYLARALAPGGKIVRYLYGYKPLPFDLTMAMTEASEGRVGFSVKRALAYCFSYDPKGKRYAIDVMRISGAVVVLLAITLFLALALGGRRKRKDRDRHGG